MFRFKKNTLDNLLELMMELSNANPKMTLEDLAHEACKDIYDQVNDLKDAVDNILYIIETNSIFKIENNELKNCLVSDLKEVEIPHNVTSIGEDAFSLCRNLTSIIIPDSVKNIGEGAFSGCINLESIIIPDGVISIGDDAFVSCYSLESIVIPSSVTSIGNYAFDECSSLTSINYNGNKQQWNAIKKHLKRNNNTGSYVIHCLDGDI